MLQIQENQMTASLAESRASSSASNRTVKRSAFTACIAVAALLALAPSSRALEPSSPLANYARQSWGMENGLPQNTVQALLQTRDGFLWLGTEVGLVRFDGNSFVSYDRNSRPALPANDIRCLLEAKDGALLVGTENGWARIVGDRWAANQSPNCSEGSSLSIAFADGSKAFANKTVVRIEAGNRSLTLNAGKELPGNKVQALFADREGALWIGTNNGLVRYSAKQIQRFPVTDPLATASILSLLEDREGNLWVGTETGGLHILRDQRFQTIGAREGLSSDATTSVVEEATLWVGTNGGGLNALNAATHQVEKKYSVRDGLLSDVILSLAAASNGDLWVGTPDGLNRLRKGKIDAYTSADGLPDDFIRSLLVDADGSLWIGTRRGLTHWSHPASGPNGTGGAMQTLTQANGLGSDLVGAMVRDASGTLWVATLAGLSRITNTSIVNFTTANGLSSNIITALLPRPDGSLLIGTQDHGWNLWDGRKFTAAKSNGIDQTTIRAILDDGLGHLWFATGNGIARCDCSAMRGAMKTTECSHWVEFGPADGLRSRETAINSHPSAWRGHDGHLWFATPKGLVEVDPAHFPVNIVPAPVALERFAVDDLDQALLNSALRISAGHVHFQFDYAGLSFTAPQKMRYRYMLDGFDRGWTEAGARRTAYYTNIPPGKYTFRVQAANNDGLWNSEGAALSFELRPHFYQTLWFYGLLLALAIASVALGLRLRLRRAEGEFRAVLGERSRIAREIHDTLAQGYVGISVQLEVLAELLRMKKIDAAAQHLDLTRGYVREGLAEARQSIWALRSQDSGEITLPVKIRRLVEAETGLAASFSSFGAYRPLPPGTEQEILRVAQEAIHNVKKHAGAHTLTVQLEYGAEKIALEVRDDGRGFAVESMENVSGHYGLTGMRERAASIGGHLEVSSEPGQGTAVRLEAHLPRENQE